MTCNSAFAAHLSGGHCLKVETQFIDHIFHIHPSKDQRTTSMILVLREHQDKVLYRLTTHIYDDDDDDDDTG